MAPSAPGLLFAGLLVAAGCRSDATPLQDPAPTREVTAGTEAAKLGGDWYTSTAYCVEADGRASQVHTQCPSGDPELDAAHRAAVKGWTFAPATRGGRAVRSCDGAAHFEAHFPAPPKPATDRPTAVVVARAIYKPDPDQERVRRATARHEGRGCRFVNLTSFCVDLTGTVIRLATRRSSAIDELDAVLRETVAAWRFTPFLVDGEPRLTCSVAEFRILVM